MRVDVSEFEADTIDLGAKMSEATRVIGKELLFSVDSALTQLTLSASGSFVGFNVTQLLLSLEMSGTVFLSSSAGVEVLTERATADDVVPLKGLDMYSVRLGPTHCDLRDGSARGEQRIWVPPVCVGSSPLRERLPGPGQWKQHDRRPWCPSEVQGRLCDGRRARPLPDTLSHQRPIDHRVAVVRGWVRHP
mgnify:CR=1 FL=1